MISCREVFGGDYLELWTRNISDEISLSASKMVSKRRLLSDDVLSIFQLGKMENKNVGIWGCGAKTQSIFAFLSNELRNYTPIVIDRDPNKQGLYLPNTNIKVIAPENIELHSVEIIIVLALSYIDEIINEIQTLTPSNEIQIFTFDHKGNGSLLKVQ